MAERRRHAVLEQLHLEHWTTDEQVLPMESDDQPSVDVLYILHTRPLPCRYCGTLTVISAFEPSPDGTWVASPLCVEHRPALVDEKSHRLR